MWLLCWRGEEGVFFTSDMRLVAECQLVGFAKLCYTFRSRVGTKKSCVLCSFILLCRVHRS